MFGYVRAAAPELKVKELTRYKAYYCGVCKAMSEYTFWGRGLLSFDLAFYALLIDFRAEAEILPKVCLPKFKKTPCAQGEALRYAAALNVLLAAGKVKDDVDDGEAVKKALEFLLRGAERRADLKAGAAAATIRLHLAQLRQLEQERCDRIDAAADAFASMCAELCVCAPCVEEETAYKRVIEHIGYHVARWVYLIDAYDDMENDAKKGCYNPIALEAQRRQLASGELALWIKETLFASLHDAVLAVNLLPESFNKPILYNIIAFGLCDKTNEIMKKKELNHGSV